MEVPKIDAIYFMTDTEEKVAQRIDWLMIEPMHKAGYIIIKMWLDGKFTEEWLYPDNEIPEGFIQKSEYGDRSLIKPKEE